MKLFLIVNHFLTYAGFTAIEVFGLILLSSKIINYWKSLLDEFEDIKIGFKSGRFNSVAFTLNIIPGYSFFSTRRSMQCWELNSIISIVCIIGFCLMISLINLESNSSNEWCKHWSRSFLLEITLYLKNLRSMSSGFFSDNFIG